MLQQFAALNNSFYIKELHPCDFSRVGLLAKRDRRQLRRKMFVLAWEDMDHIFGTASKSWANHFIVLLLSSLPAREGKYLLPTPLKAALKMNTLPSNRVGIRTPESEACWKMDESVWSDVCTISFRAHFNV